MKYLYVLSRLVWQIGSWLSTIYSTVQGWVWFWFGSGLRSDWFPHSSFWLTRNRLVICFLTGSDRVWSFCKSVQSYVRLDPPMATFTPKAPNNLCREWNSQHTGGRWKDLFTLIHYDSQMIPFYAKRYSKLIEILNDIINDLWENNLENKENCTIL